MTRDEKILFDFLGRVGTLLQMADAGTFKSADLRFQVRAAYKNTKAKLAEAKKAEAGS